MVPSSGLDAKPYAVEYIDNPSQETLRDLALKHTPCTLRTKHGNLDKISRNKSRLAKFTYVVAPAGSEADYSAGTIAPDKAAALIEHQRQYIERSGKLIEIDGYLGLGTHAVGVQWLYTLEGANIAGMQQVLGFSRADVEPRAQQGEPFRPAMRVVYTPDCFVPDMPGGQVILCDLHNFTTYVMGPDYFGESKKGALRMLNELVYQRGGLVLHAGAKEIVVHGKRMTMTIMGLSGTGKTTTTFSKQGELARPIQDDMVTLWPGGAMGVTENGCFAKTFDLTPESEPVIYHGTVDPSAWVENVFVNGDGTYAFSKGALTPAEVSRLRDVLVKTGADAGNIDAYVGGKVRFADVVDEHGIPQDGWDFVVWTQNGRSIIPMSAIQDSADLKDIPAVRSMGILNRDEGPDAAMPGIVRFTSPQQAAGYFMLGETSKTSAAGKERGKTRSPFTQPFFPRKHSLQAERFSELAATMKNVDVWLMNTGYVGGDARAVERNAALKVKIRHSSAMLQALLMGTIRWKKDSDWGYEVVDVDAPENAALVRDVPREILNPVLFFKAQGREPEYRTWVETMRSQRKAFLEKFEVRPEIVRAVIG
jgi:phosphoenolpyruvate carboxykinase (ATP)